MEKEWEKWEIYVKLLIDIGWTKRANVGMFEKSVKARGRLGSIREGVKND